jgi:hypothetical protein
MNIYYLKKFRKEAWENIKIRANRHHRDRFNVINLDDEEQLTDLTMEAAKKVLKRERIGYIIRLCQREKRIRLNKQLAKL